ncbi:MULTISPECIES: HNH endonuclease [unclassified Pseudoalteromonas]|uniref:HNH endonuclease n=1 Tax=unclassified Pseudoalteromonas TaxID=194690 RepID=UPI001EF6CAFF|nr:MULTISPECIES: HNH endonuclease [unclassified Pseudoalteromonas]MCG7541922.1 HNH endonuclease [Pseudoalteromonas sp. OF7H-1]
MSTSWHYDLLLPDAAIEGMQATVKRLDDVTPKIDQHMQQAAQEIGQRVNKALDEYQGQPPIRGITDKPTKAKADELEPPKGNELLGAGNKPKTLVSRLPRKNGKWATGVPGDGTWQSTLKEVNEITGGQPITFKNGRPDFTPWSKGQIAFAPNELNGTRQDFGQVYKYIADQKGLKSKNAARQLLSKLDLTPHHASATIIQLIPTKLHGNIPHIGSASDLRKGK